MSTLPPTDTFEFGENSPHNEATLQELASAIEFSQGSGALTLLLVRCNYQHLRQQMIMRVIARLAQADLRGAVHVLELQPQETNLYARIQATIQGQVPGAVMVVSLETVEGLDDLLVAVNQQREDFRRQFHFPLVLWLNDDTYDHLRALATDFESIAGGETLEFTLSAEVLSQVLDEGTHRYLDQMLAAETSASFEELRRTLDLGYLQRSEVAIALANLQALQSSLEADLQTRVDFIQALGADPATAIPLLSRCADYWQTSPDAMSHVATFFPDSLKQGLALFYRGQAEYLQAEQGRTPAERPWLTVRRTLEQCQQTFDQAGRSDLTAKMLTLLGRTLQQLEAWDALETLARQAIPLHEQYGHTSWLAQDYGFLSRAALKRQQWQAAKQAAQQGLAVVDQLPPERQWLRQLYLVFLAQAEEALEHPDASLEALEAAQALGDQGRSPVLVELYQSLQRQYRQRHRYLDAFRAKQRRLTVEQQYGLRAFVGARRLRAQRQDLDPDASLPDTPDSVAPEIAASGRQGDLEALLNRISRSDYKLIVLHGVSGVGKSSLVTGGLVPALQQRALENRDNVPVLLRQYADWATDLETQLTQALSRQRRWSRCQNTTATDPMQRSLRTLANCEAEGLRPVLIFDQFEEFFFANPDRLARRTFFQFIADCLDLQPSALKLVLSLREDYLHYLLEAKQLVKRSQLPEGSMARSQLANILGQNVLYEIGNFSPADAKTIIHQLASGSRLYLEPALIDALVEDLAGPLQAVRPIEMQIVGAQLQTDEINTLAHYRQLGDQPKETLVQRYLEDVVADCGEENRQLAELVLFLLTDDRGTRPLKTQPELIRDLETFGITLPRREVSSLYDSPTTHPLDSAQGKPPNHPTTHPLIHSSIPDPNPKTDPLNLILIILCGSGIVVHSSDTPNDRYQLVHDYLAEVVRAQQAPRLERLMAELEEEKRQRRLAEAETAKLTAANEQARQELALIQTEREDLQQKNRQARRVLAGTVTAAALLAAITGGAGTILTDQVRTAEATVIRNRAEANRAQREADFQVLMADYKVGMATLQEDVAERRAVAAIEQEQAAQKTVEAAQQQVKAATTQLTQIDQRAKQEQRAAQVAIQQAEVQVAAAQTASQQAQADLQLAQTERENAFEEREQARSEAALVRRVTTLERAGVTAPKNFNFKKPRPSWPHSRLRMKRIQSQKLMG